jgi:hypothetical protein
VRRSALPLADVAAFRGAARRTLWIRSALAAALLVVAAAAYAAAPVADVARADATAGRGSVVILDVSGSIDDRDSAEIQRTLADVIRAAGPGGRTGLVLFSDIAMETLPPTAPVAALQQFRRFFIAERSPHAANGGTAAITGFGAGHVRVYPQSPWGISFSGGTAISTGLREARLALRRAKMSGGRVLLVSDLVDAPQDMPRLKRELYTYARDPRLNLVVRAVDSDLPRPIALYKQILGARAVAPAKLGPPPPLRVVRHHPLPIWLIAAAAVLAVALAVHELVAAPLRWRVGEVVA